MKVIAIIRRYNDFDQLLPIIDYSIKNKKTKFDIFNFNIDSTYDSHVDYIRRKYSIELKNIYTKLYIGPYRKILNFRIIILNYKKSFSKIRYGNLLFFLLVRIIESILNIPMRNFVKGLNVNDTIIMDTGSEANFPNRSILMYAKKYGIKVNCFAHGYFIWTNLDNTRKAKIHKKRVNKRIMQLFKGKRIFADSYLTSPHQKEYYFMSSSAQGFDKNLLDRVHEIGAPRYTREWNNILRNDLFGGKSFKYGNENKLNIVFFLSHFQYNVIEEEFFKTFDKLIALNNINFVYKPHTRGHLAGIDQRLLSGFNAFEIPSILLSEWADIGILFGSSIGFQLLLDGVPIIIPKYIHTNSTIFEKYKIAIEVDSCNDLVKILNKNKYDLKNEIPEENINKFFDQIIYGGMGYNKMMDIYIKQLGI